MKTMKSKMNLKQPSMVVEASKADVIVAENTGISQRNAQNEIKAMEEGTEKGFLKTRTNVSIGNVFFVVNGGIQKPNVKREKGNKAKVMIQRIL